MFGRAAKRSIEEAVYALLNANAGLGPTMPDAQPFFHSNRANVNGTSAALTVNGLDADRVVMAAQKDVSGNEFIDARPSVLLVPSGLGGVARLLNRSEYDPDASNKLQRPNIVGGLFKEVVDSPRLTNATRRYLFCEPTLIPAFMVVFLQDSASGPILESRDGWRIDGTELRVKFDFAAQVFDPKGAVSNAGT